MRILVTGGSGSVGRAAVSWLVGQGHSVRVIGRRAQAPLQGVEYRACDISDYRSLKEQMQGIEGVVHLAAIPTPSLGPPQEIYRVNCAGTFNVYQAAVEAGVRRVVSASSINAVGYLYGAVHWELDYLPLDEEHRAFTSDAYSFSKQVLEDIAAYFWRREGVSGVCLRLPAVYPPESLSSLQEESRKLRDAVSTQLALGPEAEQGFARALRGTAKGVHDSRMLERPEGWPRHSDPTNRPLFYARHTLFAVLDARDSAQAIEQGLLRDYQGSHALFVGDRHNSAFLESRLLARLFYPDVPLRTELRGTESLVSIDRARTLLGFEPRYSVSRFWAGGD